MDSACWARVGAPGRYTPRHPSQSVLYRCVQGPLATWLVHCREGQGDAGPVPAYVEREFRRYLECGVLAHGFSSRASAARDVSGELRRGARHPVRCGTKVLDNPAFSPRAVIVQSDGGTWYSLAEAYQ